MFLNSFYSPQQSLVLEKQTALWIRLVFVYTPWRAGGINRLNQRLTLHIKDWGKRKASQGQYHGCILWFSMRRVVQFSCLACLLLTEVPSVNPQNSAISTMIHGQSHGSSLLGNLHWFFFQSVILILLPGITQRKKLFPDRAYWPHSVQWSKIWSYWSFSHRHSATLIGIQHILNIWLFSGIHVCSSGLLTGGKNEICREG